MVANAGIGPPVDFLETTTQTMNDLWEINIRGVMYCYQAAARQMIKQGEGGRLIAASSIAGLTGFPQLGMYSASKFAVRGLNQCAAAELGKYGIACNTYNPGVVQTDMWTGLDKFYSGKAGAPDGSALAAVSRAARGRGSRADGSKRRRTRWGATRTLWRSPTRSRGCSWVRSADAWFLAGPDAAYVSGASLCISVSRGASLADRRVDSRCTRSDAEVTMRCDG
jgi:meso-butanediol dehydrogenase/(S,S)-butanediol dehydrogenase/diacetyl reductase